jgi:DNA-binding NtrC family response regulator
LQLARTSNDSVQVAWSAVQLFRLAAETQPREGLAALLSDVRRHVTRAGDAHAVAYMHDAIALMEASAGALTEARRHHHICISILGRHPNAWLQQVALISAACLDHRECKYNDAIGHLARARRLTPITGANLEPILDCNEGHALAALGRFDLAMRKLSSAAETPSALLAFGALEGLARVYLATNRPRDCEDVLKRIEVLSREGRNVRAAFGTRWICVTEVKLLLQKGLWRDAVAEIDAHVQRAAHLDDQLLNATLFCLKVEAQARSGAELDAAKSVLALASIEAGAAVRDRVPDLNRAISVSLQRADPVLAGVALARARAIWADQGNVCAELELPASALDVESAHSARFDTSAVANCLSSVFSVSYSPGLLGRELLQLIRGLECAAHAEVVVGDRNGDLREEATERSCLPLGEDRGRKLTLVCRIPRDPSKAILLMDVFRIARAALELQRYREEERHRAALWAAEPLEAEPDALFLSDEMQRLLLTARRVATTNVPVLITGETGTGKEVLARIIHACSRRAHATFLPFNCTSTPKDMLDSQLFGHRRGAFTGAIDHFPGVVRTAAGGTLFLDEIGEIGLDLQPKLLRFLESGEIHPVGDAHPTQVDVRVMAATNADLDTLVAEGRFREDLFYRLNIVRLHLPPLRERRVEIPTFARQYLRRYAEEFDKGDLRLAEETMEYLVLYHWPGNVRHLTNEMRRLAVLAENDAVLMPEHLSPEIAASRRTRPSSERSLAPTEVVVRIDQPLAAAVQHVERTMVQYALQTCGERLEETAAMLGLSRKGLYLKRLRFGLLAPGERKAQSA